jgi:hypothetical protein
MAEQRVSLREYVGGFSRPFWAANISELFERIAYYGMAPVLVPYLVQVRNFDETAAIRVNGNLGFIVYALPILSGIFADWLGYRRAMCGVRAAARVLKFGAPSFPASWPRSPWSRWRRSSAGHPEPFSAPAGRRRPVGFSIYTSSTSGALANVSARSPGAENARVPDLGHRNRVGLVIVTLC